MATPIIEQSVTATGESVTSVVLPSLAGGTDQTYMVFVSRRGTVQVSSISGGGLTWTHALTQCGARLVAYSEVWIATGSPSGDFTATVTMSGTTPSVVLFGHRISGATTRTLFSSNTNGQGEAATCGGGVDNATMTLDLASTDEARVVVLANTRSAASLTKDPDYTELVTGVASSAGNLIRAYAHHRSLGGAAADNCTHTLPSNQDWSMIGVVLYASGDPPDPPPVFPDYVLASDDFERTVSGAFGVAPKGGTWYYNDARASVSGGLGRLIFAASGPNNQVLNNAYGLNTRGSILFAVDKVPDAGVHAVQTYARRDDTRGDGNHYYRPRVTISSAGVVLVRLEKAVGGSTSFVTDDTATGYTYVAGAVYRMEWEAIGTGTTALRVRVYPDGATPPAWQIDTTHSESELDHAGTVGVRASPSSSGTTYPYEFMFDDLEFIDVDLLRQSSLVASVISTTAETLLGSTVPADLVAALRDKTTATGVKLPDGTHKFALDAFLVQTAAGHEIRYAYMVPTGRSLLVEVWEGALVVADWTHGPTALATAVHDASALNVAGGAYELWLTVT
jgi:hypothetical protein